MIFKTDQNRQIVVVRPGATSFDDDGRIKGSLDMPLSDSGRREVFRLASQLCELPIRTVYTAPCESAVQTAEIVADAIMSRRVRDDAGRRESRPREVRVRTIDDFRNVDHGLWQGKLIDELKQYNPRTFRRATEDPESIMPPGGEPFLDAKHRVMKAVAKLVKKNAGVLTAMVIPDPLGEMVRNTLDANHPPLDLWKHEVDHFGYALVNV